MLKYSIAVTAVVVLALCAGESPLVSSAAATRTLGPPSFLGHGQIRIMELGDSITAGIAANGVPDPRAGYRARLVALMKSGNYSFTMVGSRTDFSAGLDFPEHEGWPGYVLRSFPSAPGGQLYGPIVRNAILGYHPDIVLLMAGTNDLLRYHLGDAGYTIANIVESMNLVLGEIFALDPKVTMIVAGIVSSPKVPECAVLEFDTGVSPCGDTPQSIASLVKQYQSQGYNITLADGMERAVPRNVDYFPDGLHPSGLDGYDRIADVWYRSIIQVLANTRH
jgi:lysophospholipase L1-like esterase